ncbi:hypothetical protein [Streptomyces sp. SAI-127]|uniref:hypothetical protein n=1 Tax=Streptomyces sp. SAI-127 TaxID=2940543 RepID=UPI0024732588|nr:hypothetical protein [Streptomyces sp. SAI-127]MDH6489679.1 phage-related protein/uncharacterized protein YoxC [Streptomyces sp. SAI-127]
MAGEEEDYGSARITIDLDDTAAVGEAQALGQRIQNALDRATRNIGQQIRRNIQRGLTAAISARVEPDTARFQARVQRALRGLAVTVDVSPDLSLFDAALRGHRLPDLPVTLVPDLDALNRRLRGHKLPQLALDVLLDLDGLDRRIRGHKFPQALLDVVPDLTGFLARIRALLAGEEVAIRVVPDLDDFDARIRAHRAPDVTVNVDPDANRFSRALSGLTGVAGRVGGVLLKALKFGAIGIAAAGAATGIAKFVAALAPAAGLLAAVPAVVLGFQAALGALKLALAGVGDAFQAALTGDAKEFEKSLENLSPKARAAAQEVRALKPAFEELRNSVQDGFFAQIEGQITSTAKALSGPLKTGLTGISTAWGVAAKNALGYVKGAQGVANVRSILGGAQAATEGLSQTTNKLTAGVLQVAAVISDRFGAELSGGIANLGQRFGDFLQRISSGGQAVAWVDGALNTLAQLGDLLGNLGQIIGGVFSAGNAAGAGFLNNLQTVTQSVADFVNSAQGQSALQDLFATVGTIASQLGPILGALVTQVGAIAPALAPVFSALGPALVSLINALGPALAQIAPSLQTVGQALAEGLGKIDLGQLGTAIGSALSALAPLLPLAGQLVSVLASALAPVLQNLATLFQPIISALVGALLPVLPGIATAFSQLAAAMQPLAAGAGQAVAQLFEGLAPLLSTLVDALVQVSSALVPVYTALADALLPALPPIVDALTAVATALIPLLPSLAGLVAAVAPLVVMVIRLAAPVLRIAAAFAAWLTIKIVVPVIQGIVGALTGLVGAITSVVSFVVSLPGRISSGLSAVAGFFRDAFTGAREAVSSGIDSVVQFFTGLPGKITSGLSSLGSTIGQFFVSAFATAQAGLSTAVQAVVDFFVALPGRIVAGLLALPGLLLDAFTSAVAFAIIGLLTVVAGIVFVFTELPGRIYNALAALGQFLLTSFVNGFNLVTSTVSGWISSTAAFFQALPGRIAGALASLGSFLLRNFVAGFNLVRSAVTSGISTTVGFFRALPGRIAGALASLGSFLLRNFVAGFNLVRGRITSFISSAVSFFRGLPGKVASALSALPGRIASAFTSAAGKARSAVSSLISGVVDLFRGLPGKILGAIGNIGGQIMAKVKSGLPSSVRKYLPFAKGGIVYGPTHALIGEAGPEVVIPLTNPKRAAQLAQQSGLLGMLAGQARTLATATTSGGTAAVGGAVSTLRSLLAGIGNLLDNVGAQVVQGMVDGIRNNAGLVASAAADMADTAAVSARDTLEIHSPSKVFAKIGRDVGRGFVQGLTGTAAQIKSTTEKLVRDIQNAFSGKKTRLDDRLVAMLDAGNKRLTTLAAQRDALAKRIADAQKFAADTTAQALQAFSLQNLAQGIADGQALTVKALTANLQGAVDQVKLFSGQLNRLAKRGLRKDLLQQLVGLGPQQGAQLASTLASATSDQLKRINNLQGQLTKASGALGTTSADVLFDAGKQAGKGFLTGLQAQRKSIEKLMLDIAKGMQSAIRTALKIHSPSLVMRRLGEYTGAGLELGLVQRMAGIMRASTAAARSMVDAVAGQFGLLPGRVSSSLGAVGDMGADVVPLTRGQRVRQAGAAAAAGGGRFGAGTTINNHFEIREVGDGQMTAHRVVNRLVYAAGL